MQEQGPELSSQARPIDPAEFGLPAGTTIFEVPGLDLNDMARLLGPDAADAHRANLMAMDQQRQNGYASLWRTVIEDLS